MPKVFNIDKLEMVRRATQTFDRRGDIPDAYDWLTTPRLGNLAGLKNLVVDIRVLESGKFSFPYHWHRSSEEFFLILSGSATLRTPQGFQTLGKGDLATFETGSGSAHQMYNHTDENCVYLDVRAHSGFDVAEYPDTGKINVMDATGMAIYDASGRTDYFSGEDNPATAWPDQIVKK